MVNAMIKFILLLPIKIIGVIFLAIGAAIDNSNRRRIEKEKQAARIWKEQAARIEKEKRERARMDRQAQAERRRAEKERAADLERKKAMQFRADQARTDMEHYKVQRSELLKLYNEIEKQYGDAATDSKKEISGPCDGVVQP